MSDQERGPFKLIKAGPSMIRYFNDATAKDGLAGFQATEMLVATAIMPRVLRFYQAILDEAWSLLKEENLYVGSEVGTEPLFLSAFHENLDNNLMTSNHFVRGGLILAKNVQSSQEDYINTREALMVVANSLLQKKDIPHFYTGTYVLSS